MDPWFGVLAPAQTPKAVITKLNEALVRVTRDPATRDALAAQGVQALESTPGEFEARIRNDLAKWGGVVKDANVRID